MRDYTLGPTYRQTRGHSDSKYFPTREMQGASALGMHLEDGHWDTNEFGAEYWVSPKPIRPFPDPGPAYVSPFTAERDERAWELYSRLRIVSPWYKPEFTRWVDRVRYRMHGWLIRKGVLI